MKIIGRVLWAFIEYIWYPVFLTTGLWVLIQLGFFDNEYGKVTGAFVMIGVVLWKLAAMMARVDWRTRTQLLASFCWMIGYIAYIAAYHPDWMDVRPKKQMWIAMMPLYFFVRQVIDAEAVAPAWAMRWIERRKARK